MTQQARDTEMRHMGDRIQTRAIRRCGELLQQVEAKQTGRPKNDTGADTNFTRTQAAKDAGLSKRQKDTARRVANVPEPEFEEAVESADPPTVSKLADRGRKPQPKPLMSRLRRRGSASWHPTR